MCCSYSTNYLGCIAIDKSHSIHCCKYTGFQLTVPVVEPQYIREACPSSAGCLGR